MKFKDFRYNNSDIFVALGIILAATLIIVWRVDVLMSYTG